jgi:diguanylate cyclase (GGDEF)-like protein
MVDLDQLEEFNYEQRNKLLLQLGKLIKQSIKNTDYVARCYPANFAIILRHINLNQAYRVAQRLLDILEQQTIVFPEQKITVTASAGIAELSQDMDAVGLLRAAEAAMQHARKCGVSIL